MIILLCLKRGDAVFVIACFFLFLLSMGLITPSCKPIGPFHIACPNDTFSFSQRNFSLVEFLIESYCSLLWFGGWLDSLIDGTVRNFLSPNLTLVFLLCDVTQFKKIWNAPHLESLLPRISPLLLSKPVSFLMNLNSESDLHRRDDALFDRSRRYLSNNGIAPR